MVKLRAFLEGAGFFDVRTLLQSGNAIVRGGSGPDANIERRLERDAATHLGVRAEFFVRTRRELQTVLEANPFADAARDDPGRMIVYFFKDTVDSANLRALRAAIKGRETVESDGRHLYAVYPDGMGGSKLTSTIVERVLGARGTARNWNTVSKLAALIQD